MKSTKKQMDSACTNLETNLEQIPAAVQCGICGQALAAENRHKGYSHLCYTCGLAACVTGLLYAADFDHPELTESFVNDALQELLGDKDALRVVARFAVLMDRDLAIQIFYREEEQRVDLGRASARIIDIAQWQPTRRPA